MSNDVTIAAEFAKALAKEFGKGAIDAVRTIFGPAAVHLGKIGGDEVTYWRLRNLARIARKVRALEHANPGVELRDLKIGESVRLIEAASDEEEGIVQHLWSGLIYNAKSVKKGIVIEKQFVDLLKSFSAPEAALMPAIWEAKRLLDSADALRKSQRLDWIERYKVDSTIEPPKWNPSDEDILARLGECFGEYWRNFYLDDRRAAIQNLVRMRCVARDRRYGLSRRTLKPVEFESARRTREVIYSVDPREFEALISHLLADVAEGQGRAEFSYDEPIEADGGTVSVAGLGIHFPELQLALTPLGTRLMQATSGPISD